VLGVPTQHYGYCFAFGVTGYLSGTMLCRRLLARVGVQRALRIGATIAAIGGTTFAALAVAGFEHWTTVIGAMFVVLMAHGIVFPCVQAGAVAPFARQAGAASGFLGFVVMACAFPIGAWVGASHDGTIRPLAFTVAALCLTLLASAIGLARFRGRIGASIA
jgi:DHA1 family bicyclomycin/chloramphenicol resistance-like MFS transporter